MKKIDFSFLKHVQYTLFIILCSCIEKRWFFLIAKNRIYRKKNTFCKKTPFSMDACTNFFLSARRSSRKFVDAVLAQESNDMIGLFVSHLIMFLSMCEICTQNLNFFTYKKIEFHFSSFSKFFEL